MKGAKSKFKLWFKLGTLFMLTIILGVLVYMAMIYKELRSTTIEQVVQRQQNADEAASDGNELVTIPSLLEDPLEKANQLSNKPIAKQDMLDAAAILLNSGLTMKEMYYLLGQSTERLTNEEKQHIRDLLLKKLTHEEINALRNITKKYGKGLNILDPKFPIELVGVYDESERKRIQQELKEREKTLSDNGSDPSPSLMEPGSSLSEAETPDNRSASTAIEEAIEKKYKAQLVNLKNACQAEANGIVNEIAAAIGGQQQLDEDTLQMLKDKYLNRIASAENRCSGQVDGIIQNAKKELRQAGVDDSGPDTWRQEYESAKNQAQSKALKQLQSR